MSERATALNGVRFDGYATVEEVGLRGMITLRGDLSSKALQDAATAASGTAFPDQGEAAAKGEHGICWMSPDELLLLCPYDKVHSALNSLTNSLSGTHHLAANVSDARAVFRVRGPATREILAKLTPADVSPGALPPGHFRRTRLAQVPAAFWMRDDETAEIICFRSVAQYVFDILKLSATEGAEVGYF